MTDNKRFALVGNPNSGKTSTFNILTGSTQYVGNWPGVTVERKSGKYTKDKSIAIQDLPGIYSLSPFTPEEKVTRDYLLSDDYDVVINIVDATNIERNLYLTTQLIEIGKPVVLALNMTDLLVRNNIFIDTEKLSYALGVPVVNISALKNKGFDALIAASKKAITPDVVLSYDERFEATIAEISGATVIENRFTLIKLFENDAEMIELAKLTPAQAAEVSEIVTIAEKIFLDDRQSIVVNERYQYLTTMVAMVESKTQGVRLNISDKIDSFVTSRIFGLPFFLFVMWAVYYISIQTVGIGGTNWVNDVLFGELVPNFAQKALDFLHIAPIGQGLILDGIVAGVGSVLGFIPQIFVLFICLGILEDSGYMSRVAFVMDRIFRRFGLSGKSFIPMLIATGCGIPGVMASRTIENERDRRITIMVTTFMPCSAKLPVIALVAGALFPNNSLIAPSAYFVGILTIIISGIMLKKTKMLGGSVTPFIMELPNYHLPKWSNVLKYAFDKGLSFIKRAGTIILATTILLWFLQTFDFHLHIVETDKSILADIGRAIMPVFEPLGWTSWQATVSTFTGLLAKETLVSTMGVLYHAKAGTALETAMQSNFTQLSAYTLLLFNLLCAPCFAAIGAIYREMGNAKWTGIAVGFQCGIAYIFSFIVFQLGSVFATGQVGIGAVLAVIALAIGCYFLFRKQTYVGASLKESVNV
ncbi:ferrous iron transport protein B [Lactococcus carnosus]|uniref:ferrous iron transport protein B n=1 Tax=Pseudolactococcus carnosus TaxID=2749961 RepID=UPI000812A337|nr:ferrous iron transport protein B [Lactococcus carnosus]SCA91687.1 Ferrous iron transport protein B [Lactococcus piscium]MCJ1968643.1 ferrous iron transport protein B [Lactococcus carnosus]MCJ1972991.1 ferrous iron transport protein B [Lactococcus carnosus]MCJ1980831.1 ferrous iron transport protein B [Lactococcus carnosus]MCJ1988004.1 ferrous iron transport protein B [Lactococcus carnosus]